MRFAEPFKQSENISEKVKAENERLMFLELTQGDNTGSSIEFTANLPWKCAFGVTRQTFRS